jgi:tetratricopeptide (TPR) repeat protein
MKKLLRNLLTATLFVGILASCETSDPLIEEAQKNIFTQNFDSALSVLDRSIQKNPESGLPYYYKAMAYAERAVTIPEADQRKPDYKNFRSSIVKARELFDAQEKAPSEAEDVPNLIFNTWGYEHNQAIEYVNNDSVRATVEKPLQVAIAHLENAVIINPDSTLSWNILAQVRGIAGDYKGAIEALNTAMGMVSPAPANDYLRLGIYYGNLGQPEKATKALEEGLELYPDSIKIVQNLADAYMKAGHRDKSIQTIQNLIKTDPQNAQYHLALGTQLLQATSDIATEISDDYDEVYEIKTQLRKNPKNKKALNARLDSLEAAIEKQNEVINKLSKTAAQELTTVTELRPNDDLAYNYLGITYQNKYAALFEKRNNTDDNDLANKYDKQAKEELRKAMKYFEKAAEINPDKKEYWDVLSRIYTTLDMQKKAKEALDKAGM